MNRAKRLWILWRLRPPHIVKLGLIAILTVLILWKEAAADTDVVYVVPEIPDEATKRAALLLAYKLNGNSMVGYGGMIDVSRMLTPPPDGVWPELKQKKKDR